MINFRYHIVSLTAVLLALGIGLALGTAFLDEATVDVLRGQLDGLESDLDETRSRAAELQAQVETLEDEHQAIDDELGDRLLDDYLSGEPVLVIAPRGIDGDVAGRVVEALGEADADLLGVWWFTNRFGLEEDGDIEALADVLDLTSSNTERLQRDVVVRLAGILDGATDGASADNGAQGLIGGGQGGPEPAAVATQPDLLERLHDEGFVDYEMPEDSDEDVIGLPPGGLRMVLVDGPGAETQEALLRQMLNELTAEGPAPVLIVSPTSVADDEGSDGSDEDPRTRSLLQQARQDERLADRVSTVDNLDRVAGKVATVLALLDAVPGTPVNGHYGQGEGAEGLLPPPEEGE